MASKIDWTLKSDPLILLTEKLTQSLSKYQKDILTNDKNYQGTQHI